MSRLDNVLPATSLGSNSWVREQKAVPKLWSTRCPVIKERKLSVFYSGLKRSCNATVKAKYTIRWPIKHGWSRAGLQSNRELVKPGTRNEEMGNGKWLKWETGDTYSNSKHSATELAVTMNLSCSLATFVALICWGEDQLFVTKTNGKVLNWNKECMYAVTSGVNSIR